MVLALLTWAAAAPQLPYRPQRFSSQFEAWDRVEGRWVAALQRYLRRPLLDDLMVGLKLWGPGLLYAACVVAAWVGEMRRRRTGVWRRALVVALLLGAVGVAVDWIGSQGIKASFDRPAPSRTWADIEELTHGSKGGSFWSNHAATSFAAAAVMVGLYGPRWWMALLAPAALIAFSRIYCGSHYPSDVVAGAAFGTLAGWAAGWWLRRRRGRAVVGPGGVEPPSAGL